MTRYQRAAWKLAFSFVGNMEDAKELSQNGFVNAYQHLKGFRKQAKFSTWLYRIIVNECKDFFKQQARQPRGSSLAHAPDSEGDEAELLFDVADPGRDPSEELANQELARRVGQAITALPMKQRTAFVLHHLHGLSLEETSAIMRCRVGTVKSHIFRATEHLRADLAPVVKAKEEVRVG